MRITALQVKSIAALDGFTGDDYAVTFKRLFGDSDGDGKVDMVDFLAMRIAFSQPLGQAGYNLAFDFNHEGTIDSLDDIAFRMRFGAGL